MRLEIDTTGLAAPDTTELLRFWQAPVSGDTLFWAPHLDGPLVVSPPIVWWQAPWFGNVVLVALGLVVVMALFGTRREADRGS